MPQATCLHVGSCTYHISVYSTYLFAFVGCNGCTCVIYYLGATRGAADLRYPEAKVMSPAYLSYSPSTGPRQLGGDATRLTVSIRPPPGLEHLSEKNPSPLLLPMPGPKFGEHTQHTPSFPPFPPPDVAAPHLELEETPPAPSVEPCIRLALLEFLPNSQGAGHDPSSCRPCAFYHNKGCTLGSTQSLRDAIVQTVSYALAAMPAGTLRPKRIEVQFLSYLPPWGEEATTKTPPEGRHWTLDSTPVSCDWGEEGDNESYIYIMNT